MRLVIVVRHPPRGFEGPYVVAHVTERVQRLWFAPWQLRSFVAAWRSARALYGTSRVSIELW